MDAKSIFAQSGDAGYHDDPIYTQSDMDHAHGVAMMLKRERDEARSMIGYLIGAAGEIRLSRKALIEDSPGFVRWESIDTDEFVFRPSAPTGQPQREDAT